MAIHTFGVTADSVRTHFFPGLGGSFSTTTAPTAATVDEIIQDQAGTLDGKLRAEGQDPAAIQALTPARAAYLWCRHTLRLACAIRVAEAMGSPQYAGAIERWQTELDARWEALDDKGASVLGDGAVTGSTTPNGPLTHINAHGLDVGDEADISDLVPRFRRSDSL